MADNTSITGSKKPRMGRIEDRPYWIFIFSIFVRAVHQLGAAVFLAAYLFPDKLALPQLYLFMAATSGIILMGAEWYRHRQLLKEFSGLSTMIKLVLLGLAYHTHLASKILVVTAFLLASVCSHAPKAVRHRLMF